MWSPVHKYHSDRDFSTSDSVIPAFFLYLFFLMLSALPVHFVHCDLPTVLLSRIHLTAYSDHLIEVLSVIIQVTYFKATHGKRIFKMAPIHHHFELCGWSETRVVAVFSVITAVMCMVALLAL